MAEALTFTLGLLIGVILTYIYMRKQGIEIKELYADSLLKNRYLKEYVENGSNKSNSNWKRKNKKYHGRKKQKS